MQLGCSFTHSLRCDFQTVVDVVCVSIWLAWRAKETAKLAVGVTNVCGVEMAIDVEVSRTAVSSPAFAIRKFAECGKIRSRIQRDAIVERESFSSRDARRYLI